MKKRHTDPLRTHCDFCGERHATTREPVVWCSECLANVCHQNCHSDGCPRRDEPVHQFQRPICKRWREKETRWRRRLWDHTSGVVTVKSLLLLLACAALVAGAAHADEPSLAEMRDREMQSMLGKIEFFLRDDRFPVRLCSQKIVPDMEACINASISQGYILHGQIVEDGDGWNQTQMLILPDTPYSDFGVGVR